MSTAAATAIRLAAKTRQRLQGLDATYIRGDDTRSLRVVPGRSARDAMLADGVAIKLDTRDLLIIACELTLGGQLIKPARHDRIQIKIGDVVQTVEVAPLVSNAQPWEWVDVYGVELRVHVQRTDT